MRSVALTAGVFGLGIVVLLVSGVAGAVVPTLFPSLGMQHWLIPAVTHVAMLALSLTAIALFGWRRRSEFGLKRPTLSSGVPVYAGAVLLGVVSNLIFSVTGQTFNPVADFTPLQVILLVWGLASVAEELLCRSLLQGLFDLVIGRNVSAANGAGTLPIILAALFFALMHLPLIALGASATVMAVLLPSAFLLGLLAGLARERSGSVVPAVVVHALVNATGSLFDWFL